MPTFSRLTHMPQQEARRAAEEAAKRARRGSPTMPDCAGCHRVGEGCFGFGDFSDGRPGALYACADPECRARVEAMVAERDAVGAGAEQTREIDLFGRAA